KVPFAQQLNPQSSKEFVPVLQEDVRSNCCHQMRFSPRLPLNLPQWIVLLLLVHMFAPFLDLLSPATNTLDQQWCFFRLTYPKYPKPRFVSPYVFLTPYYLGTYFTVPLPALVLQ